MTEANTISKTPIRAFLHRINSLPIWRLPSHIWGFTLIPPTFDRWLCLWLHRIGILGSGEKQVLERLVKPGMRVVDIGANQGLYALLLDRIIGTTGKVLAFEPHPKLYQSLTENIRRNRASNIEAFRCGLGSVPARLQLVESFLHLGDSRVSNRMTSLPAFEIEIKRLDDLNPQSIDFILMDIQGYELKALQGMRETLARNPDIQIYFEFWPKGLHLAGDDSESLMQFFRDNQLSVFRLERGQWHPVTDFSKLEKKLKSIQFANLLAARNAPGT